jgi:hypothetical protein
VDARMTVRSPGDAMDDIYEIHAIRYAHLERR